MQLPQAVEDALQAGGVGYSLLDSRGIAAAGGVRSVVLQDQAGKVQALVPGDCLLDLAALNRLSGRDLVGAPEETLGALCTASGLLSLPGIPYVLDMPVVIDQRLLEADFLTLDAGADQTLVQIAREDFRKLVQSGSGVMGNFCVHIDEIGTAPASTDSDSAEIGNAVAKFTSRRIEKRLEDTLDFPPLPEIAHRIIQIGADPYASVKDLARVIEIDPSLSAQVVSWASSPYYAAPGKISSIQDAIVRVLGFDLVMNLALGLSLGKTLRMPREGRYGYRNYWLQAAYCAAMVEGLCKAMPSGKRPTIGYAYLSGLMHNFGFLILAELFKPQLQLVCRYTEANPHLGHWAVERFLLGVTREQMAAWLMNFWHLPPEVCTALRFQNDPAQAGEHETLARVLYLAVRMLRQQGIGTAPAVRIPDSIFEELGISRDDASKVSERIHNSADDLKAIAQDLAA